MSGDAPVFPEIDGDACVHALAPHASCSACVQSCPRAAWVLTDDGLGLNTTLCDGCGLCVPACPRAAITLARPVFVLHDSAGVGTAWAACSRSAARGVEKLPCLHAIGERDLETLARDGVRSLMVQAGECASCPRGTGPSDIFAAAQMSARLRESRGEAAVEVKPLEARAFDRALARAREDHEAIDRRRRRLFAPLIDAVAPVPAHRVAAQRLARHQPVIEPTLCVACDACIHICPDGALAFGSGAERAYRIQPEACSGCRLCMDVCDQNAIGLVTPGCANLSEVPLDASRCKACGVRYYQLHGQSGQSGGLCRICSRTNHHKNLYQVFKDE